jgi:hypothetical protein
MAVTIAVLIASKNAPTSQTTEYTSTAVKTILDKFTAHNTTAAGITFVVNLVPSGGVAGAANQTLSKTIQPAQTYTCPELVGHTQEAGDFISLIAGATGLTIRASGRQVS